MQRLIIFCVSEPKQKIKNIVVCSTSKSATKLVSGHHLWRKFRLAALDLVFRNEQFEVPIRPGQFDMYVDPGLIAKPSTFQQ